MSSPDESDTNDAGPDVVPTTTTMAANPLPSKVIVTVGTYDGVLAGWELKHKKNKRHQKKLEISFATPVHGGSVRSLCLASGTQPGVPGSLLSTGYDEMLKTHDWHRRLTSSGEVRTPTDFGTPICASFAPPPPPLTHNNNNNNDNHEHSTHCLVGFSSGKLVIYKKRDWSIQHVLAGHVGGIASLAVHPSGKLALTGGQTDAKLKLWDLTKGRLSFATKISNSNTTGTQQRRRIDPITSLVWSQDGTMYAFCSHGSHITVRDVATGDDWCDVDLPGTSRVNQLALLQGPEGIFCAAACNDGSLPVLAVKTIHDEDVPVQQAEARRAIMAIEPVEGPIAGEERYKCICTVAGYYVATANSAGVISLMNLQGAIHMMMTEDDNADREDDDGENPAGSDNDGSSDEDDDEEEMAVDIIDAVQLGTGARVTCLVAWACADDEDDNDENEEEKKEEPKATTSKPIATKKKEDESASQGADKKRKLDGNIEMDPKEVEKARALVAKAKQMQKRKESKKKKRRKASNGGG